jgi:hypothetical protein
MMMKMMRLSDLRAASDPASIAIAPRKRWSIASVLRGYVTIHVTHACVTIHMSVDRIPPSRETLEEFQLGRNICGRQPQDGQFVPQDDDLQFLLLV